VIRIYFIFQDPFDDSGVNLSFVDVPTRDPDQAFKLVEKAAESGELWRNLYPDNDEHPYTLLKSKMMYVDISAVPYAVTPGTILGT
jgi:hypothetical protein